MADIEGRIYLSEEVANKDHRFGQTDRYIPVIVITKEGVEKPALLTHDVLKDGVERAARNPEDIPEDKSFWGCLFG